MKTQPSCSRLQLFEFSFHELEHIQPKKKKKKIRKVLSGKTVEILAQTLNTQNRGIRRT